MVRFSYVILLACLVGALGARPGQAQDVDINLVCSGSGSVLKSERTYSSQWNRDEKKYEYGTQNKLGKSPFSGTAYVQIAGTSARIRLPSALIPIIQSGVDGWFTVSDVFITDREITGRVRINGLNKPSLRISRGTGAINLENNLGDFAGICDRDDPSRRRF